MALYLNGKKVLGGTPLAEEVIYDNTDSGLTADNTQDAVDELASEKADKSAISNLITLSGKSGSIASFSTDIADKLFSCYVNVVASQAGSGTPAPDNVRAISGWSECNLTGCANNVWDEKIKSNYSIDGSTGQDVVVSGVWCTDSYILLAPNTNYYLKSAQYVNARWYDANKTYLGYSVLAANTIFNSTTAYPNARYLRFNGYGSNYANDISINYPSTDTAYHKYNGTTHNIPFNQTVYGCVLDVLSGVLTVTHGYKLFNGSEDWQKNSVGDNRYLYYLLINYDINFGDSTLDLSNMAPYKNAGEMNAEGTNLIGIDHVVQGTYNRTVIYANLGDAIGTNDATSFKAYLSNHNLQLCYSLATPVTYQLTPAQVATLLGQNNIFGDCGDIDLKYLETIGNRL